MTNNRDAAIFLDRDGTIIEDNGHLSDLSEIVRRFTQAGIEITDIYV